MLGASHKLSLCFCIALALLLAQGGRPAEAVVLCRFECDLGPQDPQTLKDAAGLIALLHECGEDASAALLEQRLPLSPDA